MTREDIISMARGAGCTVLSIPGVGDVARYNDIRVTNLLERFTALVAAKEREECAKVCEDIDKEYEGEDVGATWCAEAIRARGKE